jgi:opacity protein-like surface antigen
VAQGKLRFEFNSISGPDTYTGIDGGASRHNKGIIFDGFAGYDWKVGANGVFGLQAEASISALSANLDVWQANDSYASTGISSMRLNWMASALARLGWTPDDRSLFYVNGGWSFANFETKYMNRNFDLNGPTVGFGAAHKIDANWALLAEYRFTHFKERNWADVYTDIYSITTYNTSARVDLHAIRAGLLYQWH